MATAYASSNTAIVEEAGSDQLTITKPTGLAEGDLMVAVLGICDTTNAQPLTTGWTRLANTNGQTNVQGVVHVKVASSADAAASNFTFNVSADNGGAVMGVLVRFTGASFTDSNNVRVVADGGGGGTSIVKSTDTEPFSTSSVFLMACVCRGDVVSFDSFAIANNNPSWTEIADFNSSTFTRDGSLGAAYATPSAQASTGNSTITVNSTAPSAVTYLISVQEDSNITATHSHLTVSPTIVAPTASVGVVGTHAHLAVSPSFTAPTALAKQRNIANITKNSAANIRNISKS